MFLSFTIVLFIFTENSLANINSCSRISENKEYKDDNDVDFSILDINTNIFKENIEPEVTFYLKLNRNDITVDFIMLNAYFFDSLEDHEYTYSQQTICFRGAVKYNNSLTDFSKGREKFIESGIINSDPEGVLAHNKNEMIIKIPFYPFIRVKSTSIFKFTLAKIYASQYIDDGVEADTFRTKPVEINKYFKNKKFSTPFDMFCNYWNDPYCIGNNCKLKCTDKMINYDQKIIVNGTGWKLNQSNPFKDITSKSISEPTVKSQQQNLTKSDLKATVSTQTNNIEQTNIRKNATPVSFSFQSELDAKSDSNYFLNHSMLLLKIMYIGQVAYHMLNLQ